jgi:hypothetical protein
VPRYVPARPSPQLVLFASDPAAGGDQWQARPHVEGVQNMPTFRTVSQAAYACEVACRMTGHQLSFAEDLPPEERAAVERIVREFLQSRRLA